MKAPIPSKSGIISAAKKIWPGLRATFTLATRPRVLVAAVLTVCLLFVVKGMGREAEEMQKYVFFFFFFFLSLMKVDVPVVRAT